MYVLTYWNQSNRLQRITLRPQKLCIRYIPENQNPN